ncbi:hypothetical protein ACFMPD_03815 [Sedimentitalea sp. HM32M-2]|uniref:hypothetical protein n=1 Tax=Sedimentitalea sp. HM32M-2 TaxID=3351566 RepID=UPI003624B50F
MTDGNRNEIDLDGFFDAARRETAHLPEGLAARVLADAARVQDATPAAARQEIRMQSRRSGRWRQLMQMLGGWPAMGGLVTACAIGIWLGVAPPQALPDPAGLLIWETALFGDDSLMLAMAEER